MRSYLFGGNPMNYVLGTDISFYQRGDDQPHVDFEKMKSMAEFVIIRAGQGNWKDRKFDEFWSEAKGILPRGSYWFYDSRYKPEVQAQAWLDTLGSDTGELPLFADYEERYNGSWKGWRNFKKFLEELERLTDKEIVIYTGHYYWLDNSPTSGYPIERNYFAQFDLWIARYTSANELHQTPAPFEDWLLWQYTDRGDGKAFGVQSGSIDLNRFRGTLDDFNKRFGLGSVIPPISNCDSEYERGWHDAIRSMQNKLNDMDEMEV